MVCDEGKGPVKLYIQGFPQTTSNPFLNWPFIDIFFFAMREPDRTADEASRGLRVVELSAPTLESLQRDGRLFNTRHSMCNTITNEGFAQQSSTDLRDILLKQARAQSYA